MCGISRVVVTFGTKSPQQSNLSSSLLIRRQVWHETANEILEWANPDLHPDMSNSKEIGSSALVSLTIYLAVATAATSAKTLTITGILGWFGGPSLVAGAEGFLAKHPDVELNITGGSPDQVIVGIVGGAPADIVGFATGQLPSWAAQGLFEPVTAYVERSGVDPGEFIPRLGSRSCTKGMSGACR